MIYLTDQSHFVKYLLMIHLFYWKQLIRKNLKLNLIRISSWLAYGYITGKCFLILTIPNKLQKFASHVSHEAFNKNKIQSELDQNHLQLILDCKLYFHQQIDDKINKYSEIIWKLFRKSSLTISKSFVRPLLDYADINCDKRYNESFKVKREAV